MTAKALHIHIDRLVVEGLAPQQRQQFVRALEMQLQATLPDLAPQAFAGGRASQRIPRVSAKPMRAGATPEQAATHITSALRGAIARKGDSRA